ncbi:cysteine-rich receptor-like protein kinase 5 isoform X2 [Silene latifolia]
MIPSAAQGVDDPSTVCAPSISTGCDNTTTNATYEELLVTCCKALKDAAGFERECFCNVMNIARNQSTTSDESYNTLLTTCEIPGTVDSLCPETTPSLSDSSPSKESGSTPSAVSDTPSQASESKIGIVIGIVVGVVVVVLLVIGIIFFCKRTPKPIPPNNSSSEPNDVNYSQGVTQPQTGTNKDSLVTPESLQYEFEEIQVATNNFSKDNKIGQGGFGSVYKGALPNGQLIAVKRLANGSGQGDKEFQTEIVLLAKLQHRNLVRLLGFCLTDEEAILVYEFVANKSLDYFLFDNNKRAELNWSCRFEIIKGVTRGMMYIHDDSPVRMMHRDLKAANVLLDAEMYPKIADFGLARICDVGQTHINATRVVGTHGYMAPEYLFHGQFSVKSDVYALGVLILEIVSGRKVNGSSFNQPGGEGLLSYAWRCWEDEKPLEVMDPLLRDSFSNDEIIKCVQLGLLCVQENSNLRPTMSTVVHMLSSYSGVAAIAMPQHPAYIYTGGSQHSTTVSTTCSTARLIP